MKQNLITEIICPKCFKDFEIKTLKKSNNEIISGTLVCKNNHKFSISKGIPRLILDKDKNFVKTEDAFSKKWKKYNKNFHGKIWYNTQKKWFLERFGWKNISHFKKFLSSCDKILDAGTGIGNSAHLFSLNPKSQVFAIDASESIDFAYKKYGSNKNIHFLQADIRQLPFKKNYFDFICSDQVLHHTKNTQTSFFKLTKLLNKKGMISIYVYKKKNPMREYADDLIREQTVKMSEKECIKFSKDMTELGRSLSKLKKKITISRDIPILGIKKGTVDVQRFIYWNFLKCFWAEDGNYERSVGVNFDWYYPKFAFRHTLKEVKEWHKEMNLKIIHKDVSDSGISVTAVKK